MEVTGRLLKKPGYPTKKLHNKNVSIPSKKIKWIRYISCNYKLVMNRFANLFPGRLTKD